MTWTIRPRSSFGELAAIRAGAGAPALLLHGVGLRAEAWNPQIDALARHYAVIAPDTSGHGESAPLERAPVGGAPTLATYVDGVAAAIDRPMLVVGHSMGALMALDLAVRFPEKVRAVAALNGIYRRTREAAAAVRDRAQALDGASVADPTPTLRRWFGDAPSAAASACRDWLTNVDPQGYKQAYSAFADADAPADAALVGLRIPALFLTGEAEPNSTPAMSRAMAALAPKGWSVIVPEAAHMTPMTHADAVNAALLALFEEADA